MQQRDHVHNLPLYGYSAQSFTLLGSATLHQWRREAKETRLQVEACLVITDKYDAILLKQRERTLQGWALAQTGQEEAGIALIRRGLDAYRAQGATLTCPYMLAMLAESYGQSGNIDDGLDAITEALELVYAYSEYWWEADLYRMQAELRLQRDKKALLADLV